MLETLQNMEPYEIVLTSAAVTGWSLVVYLAIVCIRLSRACQKLLDLETKAEKRRALSRGFRVGLQAFDETYHDRTELVDIKTPDTHKNKEEDPCKNSK